MTPTAIAALIHRFLDDRLLYPQEWNDFIERSQNQADSEKFRKRCYELDPLVNIPDPREQSGLDELRQVAYDIQAQVAFSREPIP